MAKEEELEQAIADLTAMIARLQAQRDILGDAVLNTVLASMQEKLAALKRQAAAPAPRPSPPSLPSQDTALTGERKLVTVMFANIPEFNLLAETMDPEAVRDLMNACLDRLVPVIEKYEGTLDKVIGGEIMALFGAPLAHENDPERALRAALDMTAVLTDFNREWDSHLSLNFGINTGPAVAGGIGTRGWQEYSVMGDAVNLAARLEQAAEPGEILVGPETYRLTAALFDFEVLEPIWVKGKSEPVSVYQPLALKEAPPQVRDIADRELPLVGRQAEMDRLLLFVQPIFAGPLAERRFAGMAYIFGEAGIGKSRLIDEFITRLKASDPLSFPALNLPIPHPLALQHFLCPADEILRQSLNPFKYFLRGYFNQAPEASPEENQARFEQKIEGLITVLRKLDPRTNQPTEQLTPELERTRPFLEALVDLHREGSLYEQLDPKLRFENTLIAFKTLILAESLRQPVVLQLEDLHWLDDDSQELVKVLTRHIDEFPLAIACTGRYRDDGSRVMIDVDPDVPQEFLELGRLTPENVCGFAEQILEASRVTSSAGPGPVTNELAAFLVEKTGGNPFFVEQLVLDLRERGALERTQEGVWALTGSESEVPPRIGTVLAARLDRLSARLKEIVQTAAVLGREFEVPVLVQILSLSGLAPEAAPTELVPAAPEVWARVSEAEAAQIWTALGETRYNFRHALMRDAAYEMQLKAQLRELHHRAAEAIEQVYTDLTTYYADLAYHYGQAEDKARERNYAKLAGEQAAGQYANTAALTYLSRALDLTPDTDASERYTLLLAREKVLDLRGMRQEQEQDLATLETLAEAMADPQRQAEVALRRAHYAEVTSDFPTAIAAAMTAIEAAQQTTDPTRPSGETGLAAEGYLRWGRALWRQGEYEAAQPQLERALTLARSVQLRQVEADSLRNCGIVHWYLGDFAEAKKCFGQALPIYRETADRLGEGSTLNNLGLVAVGQGDYVGAKASFEQVLAIDRQIGNRYNESLTLGNLGAVAADLGDHLAARSHHERALHLCRAIGNRHTESVQLGNLSLICHELEENEAALQYGQQALSISQGLGDRLGQGYAWLYLGFALGALGRREEAAEAYGQSLHIRRELGQHNLAMEPLAGLADIFLAQGNRAQARSKVEEILAHLESGTLAGTSQPFRVYLTCYRVLQIEQDPRAPEILTTAYNLLQEQASRIPDEETRRSFLGKRAHREIVQEFAQIGSSV